MTDDKAMVSFGNLTKPATVLIEKTIARSRQRTRICEKK